MTETPIEKGTDVTNPGERVLAGIRDAGRRVLPMHEYLAEHDAETFEAYDAFLRSTIYEKDALDTMTREMVLAVACVALGSSVPVIAAHVRKSMEAGASRAQLLQALEIAAAVAATRSMATSVLSMIEAESG
jgi:alkylhydroperoxidase/carboxymuconolactone decarboxylase family protein YurZ